MRKQPILVRFLALFLSVVLALPAYDRGSWEPAAGNGAAFSSRSHALRVGTPAETGLEENLAESLGHPRLAAPATGLEEFRSMDQFLTLSSEHRIFMLPAQLFGSIYQKRFGVYGLGMPVALRVSPEGQLELESISPDEAGEIRKYLFDNPWARPPILQKDPLLYRAGEFLERISPQDFASWIHEVFSTGNVLLSIDPFDLMAVTSSAEGQEFLLSDRHKRILMKRLRHELGHGHLMGELDTLHRAYELLLSDSEGDPVLKEWVLEHLFEKLVSLVMGKFDEFWARLLEPDSVELDQATIEEFIRRLRESGRPEFERGAEVYEHARAALAEEFRVVWPIVGKEFAKRVLWASASDGRSFVYRWVFRGIWEASVVHRWTSLKEPAVLSAGLEEPPARKPRDDSALAVHLRLVPEQFSYPNHPILLRITQEDGSRPYHLALYQKSTKFFLYRFGSPRVKEVPVGMVFTLGGEGREENLYYALSGLSPTQFSFLVSANGTVTTEGELKTVEVGFSRYWLEPLWMDLRREDRTAIPMEILREIRDGLSAGLEEPGTTLWARSSLEGRLRGWTPGQDLTDRFLGHHPFTVEVSVGPEREQLYVADSKGELYLPEMSLSTAGLDRLQKQEGSSLRIDVPELFSFLAQVDPEKFEIRVEEARRNGTISSSTVDNLRRFKDLLDRAKVLGPDHSLQAAMSLLAGPYSDWGPTYANLVGYVNRVLFNLGNNPRFLSSFRPPISVDAIGKLHLWSIKEGVVAEVIQAKVSLKDGRSVRFVLNVARDLTDASKALVETYEALSADYQYDRRFVMEPFGLGIGEVKTWRGNQKVLILVGEWLEGFHELHLYPEIGARFHIWWDQKVGRNTALIPERVSDEIWQQMIRIQTWYAREKGNRIGFIVPNLNAGDYVVQVQRNPDGSFGKPSVMLVWSRILSAPQDIPPEEREGFLIRNLLLNILFIGGVDTEGVHSQVILWNKPELALRTAKEAFLMRAKIPASASTQEVVSSLKQTEAKFDHYVREFTEEKIPQVITNPEQVFPFWDDLTSDEKVSLNESIRGVFRVLRRFIHAGLEERDLAIVRELTVAALQRMPPVIPALMGSRVLIFTDPETFDLVPLAVRWGGVVAVDYDGPEADALKGLLAQIGPQMSLGPYAIGTKATRQFLQEYEHAVWITSREDAFGRLGLDLDDLPPVVRQVLIITRDYLGMFV